MRRTLVLALVAIGIVSASAAGLPGKDGKLVVVRGVGWSPWHSTEHWGLSRETRDLDRRLLREAHINTLRHWGAGKPESVTGRLADGFYSIPTIHCREGAPAQFPDGSPKGLAFSDPETREKFAKRVEEHAAKFRDCEGPLCFLLGNEYSAVGHYAAIKNYQYTGFEPETQARFRVWLAERFGDIAQFNAACGTEFESFDAVEALKNNRTRYEWWLFLNRTFEQFMREAHEALKRGAPDKLTSYAKLMGTHWDPYTEDARLSFLDIGGDNLYWHWVKDWTRYNGFINDLIAAAQGRPVLLTEGGFQSLVQGEQRAGRLTKQMLWNSFLHPQVAGFCVYAYSDEWYVDGKPEEQKPSESWGIVTADRKRKPTYESVAEVYGIIEELNDFFAHCEAPPVVAVSNQALGYHAERKRIGLHDAIARIFYSDGVSFTSVTPEDVYNLDPSRTPRLIFCDGLLNCEPDGSRSALEPLLDYVREGGRMLYLCPEPWRMLYGEASVPEALRFDTNSGNLTSVSYGKGTVWFLPRNEFDGPELRALVTRFLDDTGAPRPVCVTRVRPGGSRSDSFCRRLRSGQREILLVVNSGDKKLDVVELQAVGVRRAQLLYADGARLAATSVGEGALTIRLRDIDTYALVELFR